ncbi:MAG: LON peptidase substrate-binding domain-containing protein [Terriglobia bacterium]
MSAQLLPLFPLDVVLFPGMPLPLHIFEPRYQQMIRHCRDQRQEFGVILARREGIARVGCSAEIIKTIKQYPDGRSDILTIGQSRFHLLELFEDLPYLQGRVDFLPDEDASLADSASSARLRELFQQAHSLVYGQPASLPETRSGHSFSFTVARELPLNLDTKQELLELPSEAERQQHLTQHLDNWLPQLQQVARVKKGARGNGRGR